MLSFRGRIKIGLPFRVSAEKWDLTKKEADELGIGYATSARMWIMDGLRRQVDDRKQASGGVGNDSPKKSGKKRVNTPQ